MEHIKIKIAVIITKRTELQIKGGKLELLIGLFVFVCFW